LKTNPKNVCGVKIFMGASTGNMLVDNEITLKNLFSKVPLLIATHSEDEATIRANMAHYRSIYGENIPVEMHPLIRSEEACYKSSSLAVELAKKYGTRLHILHISTAKELDLFDNSIPLQKKKITAEVCVHHLWFSDEDYKTKGNFIKWNPAVKSATDRAALWRAVLDNRIDVIATDHAPHTMEEKQQAYLKAPSGGPLVQHALQALLERVGEGLISIERLIEKTSHAPATLFQIDRRGFIREGYFADLAVVKPRKYKVNKTNILHKCGWSPFEKVEFSNTIASTFVNGVLVWHEGKFENEICGRRLEFKH
jgi:dihydroorotase